MKDNMDQRDTGQMPEQERSVVIRKPTVLALVIGIVLVVVDAVLVFTAYRSVFTIIMLVAGILYIGVYAVLRVRYGRAVKEAQGRGYTVMDKADENVEKAMELARIRFAGRIDKAGVDYFEGHLNSVADLVSSDEEKIVAYLHDILEDTDYTEDQMRKEFGDEITDAVCLMTHQSGMDEEGYLDYIRALRSSGNRLAIAVKIADLTNNSDYTRLGASSPEELKEVDRRRWDKYQKALQILTAAE